MTTGEKIFGIFGLILLGLVVFFGGIAAGWWKNPFASTPISDYDKCVSDNKTKPNGSECSTCSERTQLGVGPMPGRIQNGICIPQTQSLPGQDQAAKLRVSNPKGAAIYDRAQDGTFTLRANTAPVPANTEVTALTSDGIAPLYYRLRVGWISSEDVQQTA